MSGIFSTSCDVLGMAERGAAGVVERGKNEAGGGVSTERELMLAGGRGRVFARLLLAAIVHGHDKCWPSTTNGVLGAHAV